MQGWSGGWDRGAESSPVFRNKLPLLRFSATSYRVAQVGSVGSWWSEGPLLTHVAAGTFWSCWVSQERAEKEAVLVQSQEVPERLC